MANVRMAVTCCRRAIAGELFGYQHGRESKTEGAVCAQSLNTPMVPIATFRHALRGGNVARSCNMTHEY